MTETLIETALPRSQRLKAATRATHDALDKRIMAAGIFDSRERFAAFLRVQYRFHRDIDGLYANPALQALIPDLAARRRLAKIADDLADLDQLPPAPQPAAVGGDTALPTALGWLYVAEGSNLGGTVLFKIAGEKLGLGRDFGARHLASPPDGAARHWREFTAALDTVALSSGQEHETIRGAEDAFRRVRGYVEAELAPATG